MGNQCRDLQRCWEFFLVVFRTALAAAFWTCCLLLMLWLHIPARIDCVNRRYLRLRPWLTSSSHPSTCQPIQSNKFLQSCLQSKVRKQAPSKITWNSICKWLPFFFHWLRPISGIHYFSTFVHSLPLPSSSHHLKLVFFTIDLSHSLLVIKSRLSS